MRNKLESETIQEEESLENDNEENFNDLDNFNSYNDFYEGGYNSPIQRHSDLLKELTNFDPVIARRIRNWLGLEYDDTVKDYKQRYQAIINEKGARWAIGVLQTYQSKTNIITNLSKVEYHNMELEIIDLCWMVFPTLYDDFLIRSTADQYRLSQELQHSAILVLAGAGDGKYTKFLGESVTRTESINISPSNNNMNQGGRPNKQGWLENVKNTLLGRGRG